MTKEHLKEQKWKESNEMYYKYLDELGEVFDLWLKSGDIVVRDIPKRFLSDFGAYIGDASLAQMLYKYELYKQVLPLAGDIAEIGIWRGNSFLMWAKLVKLFECYNATHVYGFDWFQGMKPSDDDDAAQEGQYCADYQHLLDLTKWLKLDNIATVVNMDVTKGLKQFVEDRPWLRLKLLYIDCGIKEVMEASYEYLYPRLVTGGVLLMDHFNFESSPSESNIIEKYIGKNVVKQMPFARNPTGYIIKE